MGAPWKKIFLLETMIFRGYDAMFVFGKVNYSAFLLDQPRQLFFGGRNLPIFGLVGPIWRGPSKEISPGTLQL